MVFSFHHSGYVVLTQIVSLGRKNPYPTEPSYPQSHNLSQASIVIITTQSPTVTAFSLPSIWPCHYLVMQSFYFQLAHFSPNYLFLPPSFLIICETKPASFELQLHYTFFSWLSFCLKTSTWTADEEVYQKVSDLHFFF